MDFSAALCFRAWMMITTTFSPSSSSVLLPRLFIITKPPGFQSSAFTQLSCKMSQVQLHVLSACPCPSSPHMLHCRLALRNKAEESCKFVTFTTTQQGTSFSVPVFTTSHEFLILVGWKWKGFSGVCRWDIQVGKLSAACQNQMQTGIEGGGDDCCKRRDTDPCHMWTLCADLMCGLSWRPPPMPQLAGLWGKTSLLNVMLTSDFSFWGNANH